MASGVAVYGHWHVIPLSFYILAGLHTFVNAILRTFLVLSENLREFALYSLVYTYDESCGVCKALLY